MRQGKAEQRTLHYKARRSRAMDIKIHFSVSLPPHCWSQAVLCISKPRMYPQSGTFLVSYITGKMILWYTIIICSIWIACHLPALLLFTINHQRKVEQSQPPKGLQFHGGNLELEEINNSQIDENEIYIISQPRENILENSMEEGIPHQTF